MAHASDAGVVGGAGAAIVTALALVPCDERAYACRRFACVHVTRLGGRRADYGRPRHATPLLVAPLLAVAQVADLAVGVFAAVTRIAHDGAATRVLTARRDGAIDAVVAG